MTLRSYTSRRFKLMLASGKKVTLPSPCLMGIFNLTPDSFFQKSRYDSEKKIVETGELFTGHNAAVFDLGGESSRPGSEPVSEEEELDRVLPAVKLLRKHFPDTLISIDTYKPAVARKAIDCGADLINDISAGTFQNGEMFNLAAACQTPVILMHKKGTPASMQDDPEYENVTAEVTAYLVRQAQILQETGLTADRIIIDPGIGFGKNRDHNLTLLREIPELKKTGYPILIGASMKRIIGDLTGTAVPERLAGTLGLHLAAAVLGADILRVHDLQAMDHALTTYFSVNRI